MVNFGESERMVRKCITNELLTVGESVGANNTKVGMKTTSLVLTPGHWRVTEYSTKVRKS